MSAPEMQMSYPLRWVEGRARTPGTKRKAALWRHEGGTVSMDIARRRLREQVGLMTPSGQAWRVTAQVLSINIRFTERGTRDMNISRRDPDDVGAAFYFDLDDRPHALACDKWDRVADNIAAIAAHIEALRGQERWGVADLAQAFAGHVALPAPEQWWQILGILRDASPADIDAAWRAKMRDAHPDRGGSTAEAANLNWARDEGKRQNG